MVELLRESRNHVVDATNPRVDRLQLVRHFYLLLKHQFGPHKNLVLGKSLGPFVVGVRGSFCKRGVILGQKDRRIIDAGAEGEPRVRVTNGGAVSLLVQPVRRIPPPLPVLRFLSRGRRYVDQLVSGELIRVRVGLPVDKVFVRGDSRSPELIEQFVSEIRRWVCDVLLGSQHLLRCGLHNTAGVGSAKATLFQDDRF